MMNKNIVVIDDDLEMREGLDAWLSSLYRVKTFASAEDFLDSPHDLKDCQCLLLDLQMPGMKGTELQTELQRRGFSAPIVFMSGNAQNIDIILAWRSGAFDFILKPFFPDQISDVLRKVFEANQKTPENETLSSLPISRREAQVLLLLGQGLKQQEIASQLGLSLRTVKMYRTFLKNKLNLTTLMEIGRFCDRHRPAIEICAGHVGTGIAQTI